MRIPLINIFHEALGFNVMSDCSGLIHTGNDLFEPLAPLFSKSLLSFIHGSEDVDFFSSIREPSDVKDQSAGAGVAVPVLVPVLVSYLVVG